MGVAILWCGALGIFVSTLKTDLLLNLLYLHQCKEILQRKLNTVQYHQHLHCCVLLCLFQESVPPVMPFHLGSLGFLTPFNFDSYQSQVTQVIEGECTGLSTDSVTGIYFIFPLFTYFASLFVSSPGSFCPFAASSLLATP